MNLAPNRSIAATAALASMWGPTSFDSSSVTRTLFTRSSATRATLPFFTPETRTRTPCQVEHPNEEDGDADQHDRPDSDFLLVGEVHYRPPIRLSPVGTSFA